ncbi:MAG: NADH-quinone oxidoreductase subunit M [Dehalococcoidia bacterium]|nr:NADH-quinone oxidoreductase subunit M [Dehalococcoidia bacterium]
MDFLDDNVLSLVILIPFAAALTLVLVPTRQVIAVRSVATGATGATFALSVYLALRYGLGAPEGAEFWPLVKYSWLPDLGISFQLGTDGISVLLILLNGIVALAGVIVAWRIPYRGKDFYVLFLLLVTGVFGVFASLDLFFFFFFYELAVIPMYLLIGVWGSSTDFGTFLRTKEYGAMKLVIFLSLGSVLVWIAMIALYTEASQPTFDFLSLQDETFSLNFQKVIFPLFAIGFGVLAGLWPFHTWSPDGHVAAPTPVSMLHAGVLMKLGAYGILRIGMELLPEGAEFWMPALIVLGTINVVYGAVSAMAQRDLKYVIGYSSVSHMGYVIMGLATLDQLGVNGAVLQMFSHGIMTALFFVLVGAIYDRTHLRDIDVLEGLAKRMGTTASLFAVAGLASLGLPGLSGFVAELLVFIGAFRTYPIVGVLGVFAAALTAVYILRLMAKVFFGPISERWQGLTDISRTETASALLLVAFIVVIGVWPFPWIDLIDPSIGSLLGRMG